MQRLWIILVAFVAVGMSAAVATAQPTANPHFSQSDPPTCETSSSGRTCTVCCEGTIVGVGSAPTSVELSIANSGCQTRSESNLPPGHLQATTGPITPSGGNIEFGRDPLLCISLRCPGGLNTILGDEATISLVRGGVTTTLDETIPVDDCPLEPQS
jgi:hypothetical protein